MDTGQNFNWGGLLTDPFVFGAGAVAQGVGAVVSSVDKIGAFTENTAKTAGSVAAAGAGLAAFGTAAYLGLFVLALYFVLKYGGVFAKDVAKLVEAVA